MLKVDRGSRTFSRLDEPSLSEAQLLERTDLQECIFNSSDDFFAEIGVLARAFDTMASQMRYQMKVLEDKERRQGIILETAAEGIVVADARGVIEDDEFREDFKALVAEYVEEVELAETSGRVLPPEEWPISRAIRGDFVRDLEVVLRRRKPGDERVVSYTVVPSKGGSPGENQFVFLMLDVTERYQANERLRRQQQEFSTMANSIPQLAWMADSEWWIFWYNDRWYDYTGTTLEEMEGWGWRKVHHPDHVDRVVERIERSWKTGEPWEDTFPLRGRDGTYRWFLSRALPIRDASGNVVRWFGTNTDITENMELERELRDLNATLERRVAERTMDLEQRNAELQQFAYVASHDFQEPLRKIQTFADLLRIDHGTELPKEALEHLARMENAAARMSHLLRDLLDFSRVASKTSPFEPVNVADIVEQVASDLDMNIEEAGVDLRVDADVVVRADANQLRQLVNHLILNSLKFRREGVDSYISVEACVNPDDEDRCRIVVEDNGIGFDPRYSEQIFAPFERLHGKSTYPGTGMGLAICKRIAERHDGTIRAEGRPGEGSRFIVELPTGH